MGLLGLNLVEDVLGRYPLGHDPAHQREPQHELDDETEDDAQHSGTKIQRQTLVRPRRA